MNRKTERPNGVYEWGSNRERYSYETLYERRERFYDVKWIGVVSGQDEEGSLLEYERNCDRRLTTKGTTRKDVPRLKDFCLNGE